MRYRNVPAAYVAGYYSGGGYHAWAEVYLDGAGWVSVEPQGGTVGISTGHIKLFRDVDFPAIQVKLGDIKIKASVISTPWTSLGLSGGGGMFTPAISPADPNLVLVNCDMSGVYRSIDGGQNWEMIHYPQSFQENG